MNTWTSFRPLKARQYSGEYQLFDGRRRRPGFVKIQWSGRSRSDIAALPKPDAVHDDWWEVLEPSETLLHRLFPRDGVHPVGDYELLFAIQSTDRMPAWRSKGAKILKGVLRDRTGYIVLLTSHSRPPALAHQSSVDGKWFVLKADTIAPALFWRFF